MDISRNSVFKEVYKRVTGSLDIGEALTHTHAYLKDVLPIDELILFQLEGDLEQVQVIFRISADGIVGTLDRLLLIDYQRRTAKERLGIDERPKVLRRSDIHEWDTIHIPTHLQTPTTSDILLLFLPSCQAGVIALSYHRNVYTESHVRLFEELLEPFEIAIKNAIQYSLIKQGHDALVDDNHLFREATVRLTGEHDIGTAFYNTLLYLHQSIPIDHIIISAMSMDSAEQRIHLWVSKQGIQTKNDDMLLTGLSQESRDAMRKLRDELPETFVRNIEEDELLETLTAGERMGGLNQLGMNPDSVILVIGAKSVEATILFVIENRSDYSPRHLSILQMLKEPFVIALHNAIHFFELERMKNQLLEDNQALQKDIQRDVGDRVIGMNQGLRPVMSMVGQVAKTPSPVLLLGETGSGKEVIATALHRISDRSSEPFISINCGAIPETLIDSELFGHERGAFTGANERKRGRFERADGGTLFLDEVGELPLSAQVKLLRVLQEKEFERVGGSHTIRVNVRLIAATNRDLPAMVREGRFREDLWFRLNVFPIEIPPLRQRKEDIPALSYFFIQTKRRQLNLPFKPTLPQSALDTLVAYDWPGNVRELQNAIERALILCRGEPLQFSHLLPSKPDAENVGVENIDGNRPQSIPTLEEVVTVYFRRLLDETNGRIAGPMGAARLAGIHPSTFRSKLKKLGIEQKVAGNPYFK